MGTQSGNLSQTSSSSPSISSVMHIECTEALGQSPLGPPTQTLPPSAIGSGSGVESELDSDNIQHPAVIGQKRKEPANKSPLWAHFTRCKLPNSDQRDTCWCTCNYCNEKVLCDSKKNGTSSMWSHTRKCGTHPLYAESYHKQAKLNKDNVSGAATYHKYSRKRCDDRCIDMIIKDELPFRHVEKEGFEAFCKELEPQWPGMNRKQVAKGVLDSDWKLHKRIINFCTITSHKGEEIGRVVEQCLRQWEITKVFTITVDNASANDVVVAYMMRRLRGYKTLMFGGQFLHLRCACHIINLIVRDGLKELEAGIDAIWNCAKYVRSSSQRLDKFREFAVLEQCRANANVPLDVITRWNNTYLMLEAALKYETVFGRMAEEDSQFKAYFDETDKNGRSRAGPPSNEDWRNAQAFCLFLKKFYEATVKLSALKKIITNILFVEIISLQTEIDKAMNAEDEVLKRVATSMKTKFNKYWGSFESVNKIIMIANVLDPRYKLQWAKVAMEKVDASYETINSIQGDLKKILLNMYDEYKGSKGSNQTEQSMAEDFGLDGDDDLENLDEVSRQIARERMAEQSQCIRNEVDQYLSDKYVSLLAKNFEIHKWWKANEQTYPVLSKLAKDIFAIPRSTVASENAFSLGSGVVDPFRASLSPKMVEALVCTSDWLKSYPPNFYKDPTEDDLEMYHTLEELERDNAFNQGIDASSINSTTSVQTDV
ncbi:zinc finger BED domain-containing protein RICESLEEPER 3-like [Rosa chinensis]|uniref:zinc finger BED domain-containing protein RICESLEEPER 3-like n=1 Tax=Rosa chinensis TaxID=74649 RepID=UPI001AD92396|nr:zinc finger BED domain-containing protein RICESLEEPER 3-like [Rosa chinensis]